MTPSERIEAILTALREKPERYLYLARDGLFWVTHSGPDVSLTKGEVDALLSEGHIVEEFQDFYKASPDTSRALDADERRFT